ncbi:uncharacterized protein TNCV_5007901 [Trichonephila clavipes]|nr:uncharacterized protein TNCV_5007901 [Trichonephila clavipes]
MINHEGSFIRDIKRDTIDVERLLKNAALEFEIDESLVSRLGGIPEGKEWILPEPVRQVGLLYDRWRYHRSPPPKFRYGAGGEENVLQTPALVVSAATASKTFGPTDLTSTYSVCTWRVFGGIEHRTQSFRSGIRCSNH